MRLLHLILLYSLPALIATQDITCKQSPTHRIPTVKGCEDLIFTLERENWTHLALIFGRHRAGYGKVPSCYTFRDCEVCLFGQSQELREDQFTWYSYVGSLDQTVKKCVANGYSGGSFPAGPRRIFRFSIFGRRWSQLSVSLENSTALDVNFLEERDLSSS